MNRDHPARHLAHQAFDLAEAGRLQLAKEHYLQAIHAAGADCAEVSAWHGELGAVLRRLGHQEEARRHYESALACAARVSGEESGDAIVARYSLGSFLLETGEPGSALGIVTSGSTHHAALSEVAARAAWALGHADEAIVWANDAIKLAAPDQRERLKSELGTILSDRRS